MKKIDKLVLTAFVGPFIITFLVVVFILLNINMLRYFDDIIGKGLEYTVIAQLFFYFGIFTIPTALPLAVLLSSLITFGNLGEHFELTAIKASGISLIRTLQPIFIFVVGITILGFYVNNNLVPKAALEAYSLLYDIKQKKPALELREGVFYSGLPDISIKVDKKFPKDESALKGIIVYDHRKNDGNREVTKADSGRMYTILNERYLKFELYNGYNYTEGASEEQEMTGQKKKGGGPKKETLTRNKFYKTEAVFDLSSFDLQQTDKKWFQGNRIMRNLGQLDHDIDSIDNEVLQSRLSHYENQNSLFTYLNRNRSIIVPDHLLKFKDERDSIRRIRTRDSTIVSKPIRASGPHSIIKNAVTEGLISKSEGKKPFDTVAASIKTMVTDSAFSAKIDSIYNLTVSLELIQAANNRARQTKNYLESNNTTADNYLHEKWVFEIQWHKIISNAVACICMFLIGAPLGAIIKKGGLGVPFLVSILFFIIYYLLSMQGEKLAKQGAVSALTGIWAADLVLLLIGLVFLRQARVDARLFDADFYRVVYDRFKQWRARKKPEIAAVS